MDSIMTVAWALHDIAGIAVAVVAIAAASAFVALWFGGIEE